MENQIQITNYTQYKNELDKQLRESAEGFVRIGYLLKLARDTDILNGSGYANVNEFAKAEYGLDKSMVSRFININDRFAEGGNSQYLKEQYRGFGYSKLAIMLHLPDEINEELSPEYSKTEIQAIKDEVDAEGKISDIENLIEGEAHTDIDNNLHKALYQLLEDLPELYVRLHECLNKYFRNEEKIMDELAPDGEKVYSIRISGIGRMMLFLNVNEKRVTLTNVRTMEKEQFQWLDVPYYIDTIIKATQETAEKEWEVTYGREFPKKREVAPVQPQKDTPKATPKKESKVSKAKKMPVEKTDEQRYAEEQAKIDRETKKKLQEMEDAKKMEVLPSEKPKPVHSIRIGKTFFEDAASGIKPFTLRKNDRNYQVGDILEKMEFDDGKYTGRTLRQEVIYKLEDYTGLTDGYCILGVKNIDMVEERI